MKKKSVNIDYFQYNGQDTLLTLMRVGLNAGDMTDNPKTDICVSEVYYTKFEDEDEDEEEDEDEDEDEDEVEVEVEDEVEQEVEVGVEDEVVDEVDYEKYYYDEYIEEKYKPDAEDLKWLQRSFI
jgi:hypothetical protein